MKKMKAVYQSRTLRLVGGVTMAVMLAACTQNGGGTNTTSKEAVDGGNSTPPASAIEYDPARTGGLELPLSAEPITYSFFIAERADAAVSSDWPIFRAMAERTGVDIRFEPAPGAGFEEKRMLLLATQSVTDFFGSLTGSLARQYGPDGVFLDLKPYMDEGLMPNIKAWYEKYPDATVVSTAADGGIYSVPTFSEENYISFSWMARGDVMDELGIEQPGNTDEFYDMLKQMKAAYPDAYPFLPISTAPIGRIGLYRDFAQMFTGIDGMLGYDREADEYRFAAEDARFVDMLTYLHRLYEEGLMDPEFALLQSNQFDERMLSGKSLVTHHFKGRVSQFNSKARQADASTDYRLVPMAPFAAEGVKPFQFIKPVVFDAQSIALAADVKQPEIAVQFLDYLYSDEGTDYTNYGIAGKNYEVNGGEVRYLEEEPDLLVPNLRKEGVLYDSIRMAAFDKSRQARVLSPEDAAIDELQQPYIVDSVPLMVATEEEAELEKERLANLTKHLEQKLTEFVMGKTAINDESISQFVREANQLGAAELVEMYNTQLERAGE
ncbi:extracellular solute-binding protein [Paenibacillus sp. IB182496]|uniref:Extracellular solute-binding protein n=1 Tax=Paenibacillus sabuli TaxID=2772509 RepID=A0A927BQS8_9BACL|nr:extracellular solute-binding protein [Paenibacillus sabuli]MBD2844552.1 extracellular solute-binding protein [Paenibacillus sabuli]